MQRGIVVLPGVFNALTARLAAQCGFDALYLSGAGVTNSLLAVPDVGLITLTEMAQQARYVCAAVDVPVIADADTGYGEALNVARCVEEMERAGLAGIHLEDQRSPKRCGHLAGKELVGAEEMVLKVRAAVMARSDPSFLIVARTDARSVDGLDAAIRRANAYREAGADAIFPEALSSESEFQRFSSEVKAPLLANMTEFGKTPIIPVSRFADMGCAMVIFPMTMLRVMMKSAEQLMLELKRTGTQADWLNRMQTRQELYRLIDYEGFERFDQQAAGEPPDEVPSKTM